MEQSIAVRRLIWVVSSVMTIGAVRASAQPAETRHPEAYYEFLLGRHLEREGEVSEAVAAFERARRLDPSSAEPVAELAALYARQGQFDQARSQAEAALGLDADNVEANRVLGSLYAAIADSDAKDPAIAPADAATRAIDHLERSRRSASDFDAGVDLTLARLYLNANRPAEAVTVLERVLDLQPEIAEAAVLLSRAETALGRPERAAAALEAAAAGNPRLLAARGELYERQQRWADAAAAYGKLSELVPSNIDTRLRWASALLQVDTPEAAGKARDLLRPLAQGSAVEPRTLYLLANAERRTKDFDAAEATAERLITAAPDSPSGPFVLAQIHEDQRRYDKAASALRPVVARLAAQPEPPREVLTLMAHLGFAELQIGDAEGAIATFEKARALGGGSSFDVSLIQAYVMARKYDRAADLARQARQRRPKDVRLVELEARALAKGGRGDRAVVLMREAVAENGDDVRAHLTLAEVLQEASRAGEADQALDAAAVRFPTDVSVPFQRGALLEQRKDYQGAEAAFRQALARDPQHAPTLNYLGYMLADRGERLDEAVDLVERALTIDPDNGSYLDSLGWAYFKQRKIDKAETLLRRAAEQAPGNSVVQDHYGDVLWANGRRDEAVAAWQRALKGDRESVDSKAIEAKIAKAR